MSKLVLLAILAFITALCYFSNARVNAFWLRMSVDRKGLWQGIYRFIYHHQLFLLHTQLAALILAMLCLVFYGVTYAENNLSGYIREYPYVFLIVTPLLLIYIYGVIPEYFVRRDKGNHVRRFVRLFYLLYGIIFIIPVYILSQIACAVIRFFGIKAETFTSVRDQEDELEDLLRMELHQGDNGDEENEEVKYFRNVLEFGGVSVGNCMIPRTEIVYVDRTEPTEELLRTFIESGKSKIVVCDEDLDHIIGYIHLSELFVSGDSWPEAVISMPVVPESMPAANLLTLLKKEQKSLAIIVDEFGGTAGIISIEDLIEEILGDIEDEHDYVTLTGRQLSEKEFVFSARMEVKKINLQYHLHLPESDDYITIAGLLLENCKQIPRPNDTIQIGDYLFKIIKATQRKIETVKLEIQEDSDENAVAGS